MLKRALLALLAVPAIAGLTLVAVRLTPGPQRDGTTLLPSGWRIHPAGRQVDVGTLPLNVVTLSDGSVLVTNNGYGENGLMRIDPLAGSVVWRLPLKAAWLGLARSGRDWRDTVWASGGGTNRVYRLAWQGGARWSAHPGPLADPNALALSPDGKTLYVAMAGNNAVAVVRLETTRMRVAGLVPVGWYPTAVAVSPDGRALYVANGKGAGSGANPDGKYIGNVIAGSVSIVPAPDGTTLVRYTREVYALSPYSNARLRGVAPDRLTARPPVRHVVYIIRENRTYDQVLGDLPQGNGDPHLAIFNDSITPNAHAIARRFVLFDNFYVDGEVSADGHDWSDRAFAGDYNEKTWPQIYSNRRKWDLTNGEDLATPRDAYLWDAAKRKGLWVVNFGELTESDDEDWSATRRARTNIPGLKDITVPEYPGFVLGIADTTRARLFADSVASWDRQGRFPDLVFLWLPRDHTLGRQASRPTPRSMVAENDLALGQVVERLSQSPSWSSLAVFALEDDAQNGPDHVDAHRSVLLLASPYAKSGGVDSTLYTTSSVVRSIGLILGLPPLSQYDAAATPLWNAFADRPDTTPFTHLANAWPLDELNPRAFRSRIPARDLAEADAADEALLNWEIWTSVRPGSSPPPTRRSLVANR